jgi:1-acyl-sn-glycerol-3-phosphate acyltransferase
VSRLHKPKAGFWIRLCVAVLYPLDAVLFRLRWRGLDKVPPPQAGGVMYAINHTSHLDTILMARFVWQTGRIPRFMIKDGVFDVPFIGRVMRGAKQIPVHRGTADAANSLSDAVTALNEGEAVIIYPEGRITRDPDQWPMPGKTGIARLVLQCPDVKVVPVGQWGAQQPLTQKWRLFTRRTSTVIVGDPLDLSRFAGSPAAAGVLREITDVIMAEVRALVAEARGTGRD